MASAHCPEGASAVSAEAMKDHTVKQVSSNNASISAENLSFLTFRLWINPDFLFLRFVHRKQQNLNQRRSSKACWSQKDDQAAEPPGAPASLQTAPQETCCLSSTDAHAKHTTTSLMSQHLTLGTQCSKELISLQCLNLHSVPSKCM